jgi:guanylate kinase
MTGVGVVLYGPPAAGKDTITAVLVALDAQFAHLPVVKAGSGRTASYRMVTDDEFDQRMVTGDFVFAWRRYDSRYAVSRSALDELAKGAIPVVHLGSVPAVRAVTSVSAFRWIVVQLWIARETCEARARARNTGDLDARLAAYDQTERLGTDMVQLTIDTETTSSAQAAQAIRSLVGFLWAGWVQ